MDAKIRHIDEPFKARILALLCVLLLAFGCSKSEVPENSRNEQFLTALDSAYRAAWQGFRVVRRDTAGPSRYFDSSVRYLLLAVEIEREKRLAADSIAALDALSSKALRDARLRQNVTRQLDRWVLQFRTWETRLGKIQTAFMGYLSTELDSTDRRRVDSTMTRDLFRPPGRKALDSTQIAILITQRLLLRLIDSAGKGVRIDTMVRFTDQTFVDQYERLIVRLDSLSTVERQIIAASGATGATPDVVDTLPKRVPDVPAPSWPRAVRVF